MLLRQISNIQIKKHECVKCRNIVKRQLADVQSSIWDHRSIRRLWVTIEMWGPAPKIRPGRGPAQGSKKSSHFQAIRKCTGVPWCPPTAWTFYFSLYILTFQKLPQNLGCTVPKELLRNFFLYFGCYGVNRENYHCRRSRHSGNNVVGDLKMATRRPQQQAITIDQ